ncbi:thiamine phosphate synthase [Phyllobacterium zundukense]|uniref:Thiamine-phosphate synthase n=1 Tax=Phyllobacterium zundukense TaxID=1867719 RepID=A0A2N9VU74_9HYPH|nr:thiamine phosphate synthase [Phyllobacterium zundukense]ATU93013.1 thiamine-phosphate diphosphorylase [Phyllobacterium zundukense]PIO43042.1 thiamine-phosphate diphosphorylase [Phyllobacterium zundukense]
MRPKVDFRLNAIVDVDAIGGDKDLGELALAAARGGATIIQYRDKNSPTRSMVERARAIHAALKGTGVTLVINDRIDVALAAGVEGVHIGREDMTVGDARALLGPGAIIGLTVKNEADAQAAIQGDIDYACIGGLFETPAKHNPDGPIGFDGFSRLAPIIRRVKPSLPIGAIAGIDLERTPPAIAAGADGVAVISAIFRQADPQGAAAALRAVVDASLKERA